MIEAAMASTITRFTKKVSPAMIKTLQTDLFSMKRFGKSLQTIFESIDGSHRKRYIYKQIRVPALSENGGWHGVYSEAALRYENNH